MSSHVLMKKAMVELWSEEYFFLRQHRFDIAHGLLLCGDGIEDEEVAKQKILAEIDERLETLKKQIEQYKNETNNNE